MYYVPCVSQERNKTNVNLRIFTALGNKKNVSSFQQVITRIINSHTTFYFSNILLPQATNHSTCTVQPITTIVHVQLQWLNIIVIKIQYILTGSLEKLPSIGKYSRYLNFDFITIKNVFIREMECSIQSSSLKFNVLSDFSESFRTNKEIT